MCHAGQNKGVRFVHRLVPVTVGGWITVFQLIAVKIPVVSSAEGL